MKNGNIMCCPLTQLILDKKYNEAWEHPKMYILKTSTMKIIMKQLHKIDKNVQAEEIVNDLYIKFIEYAKKYNPIMYDGKVTEFFPYIHKIFSYAKVDCNVFTTILRGNDIRILKKIGAEQRQRIFFPASELAETCGLDVDKFLESNSEKFYDDPIESLLNEEIEKEINNLTESGQKMIRAVLNTETISEASKLTGIHVSGVLLDIQRYLKREKKIRKPKKGCKFTAVYDLDVYKQIFKLMLIKNDINIDKYKNMLD